MITHLKEKYHFVKCFFRNIYIFRKTLAHHQPWDYCGILYAMRDSLDDMIAYGMPHTLNGEKHIKDMKVARELCDRLIEGEDLKFDYSMCKSDENGFFIIEAIPLHDFPTSSKHVSSYCTEKQHFDMLMAILKRKMRCWWD